ncbi:MAG: hypothetical protein K9L84_00850 [Candidatus Omnitrophica bacterium]|nr:hypothetical protein [Candidatus Omnitrophota bacterium]MCF7893598.1 hypothetical protein [Candidatus Omnitrophota bacterium]
MDNDIYQDFVKKFRVALTNCSVYFSEHPIFFQSIESFKENIDLLTRDKSFLLIQVKPEALIINGKNLEKRILYKDLATFFHRKKIKSIKIKKETTFQELSEFLLNVSQTEKNILSKGGMKKILKDKGVKNIEVDELDYSQLIKGEGKEVKDVWSYLLSSEQIQDNSKVASSSFVDKFMVTTKKYGVKEILEDKKLSKQLFDLFAKIEDKDNFKKVVRSLAQSILDGKALDNITNKGQLKSLFSYLDPQDLVQFLTKFLQSEKRFDPVSFRIFSTLLSPDFHKAAANKLGKEIKKEKSKFNIGQIKNLLTSFDDKNIISIYQKNLSVNGFNSVSKDFFSFDYKHLHQNYRLILLDLFFYEINPARLELILKKINAEIENDFFKNIDFINKFAKVYIEKPASIKLKRLQSIANKIWFQAEKNIFDIDDFRKLFFLTKILDSTTLNLSFYLDKIEKKQFNPLVFRLFFKFFPRQADKIYLRIKSKTTDFNFLKKIISDLKLSNNQLALEVFKNLFQLVPVPVKIDILDTIKGYSRCDPDFILPLTNNQNFHLRKKSIEVGIKFPQLHKQIAKNLFSLPNYFGLNSKTILENLEIIDQNYISQVKLFIEKLAKAKFFWNRQVRKKAKQILESHL